MEVYQPDDDDASQGPPFHWNGPLPAPEFVMVPKLIHQQILKHLSGGEFKVFYALLVKAYEWGHADAELSVTAIAEGTGMSRRAVQYGVQTLTEKGLIEVFHHTSDQHGHEPNTYRVRVTDDPRYVDRTPSAKTALARATTAHPGATAALDRAREPIEKNYRKEDPPTPSKKSKYAGGQYGVCGVCGSRPHAAECPQRGQP